MHVYVYVVQGLFVNAFDESVGWMSWRTSLINALEEFCVWILYICEGPLGQSMFRVICLCSRAFNQISAWTFTTSCNVSENAI